MPKRLSSREIIRVRIIFRSRHKGTEFYTDCQTEAPGCS